jgi:cytosine/adenosine deaminase-related metal-dependent hydrolase
MPKTTIRMLLPAAILTASISLLSGCATRGKKRPDLPVAFHFLEPGSTNTVVVPAGCAYGIWTTDKGLLYLQGLTP